MTRCFPYRRVPSHVHPTHICHHPFPRSPFHDRRLSFSRAPSTHYTLPRGSQLVHFGFDERDPLRHTAERRHARAQRHVYARSDNRSLPLHWKLCPSPRGVPLPVDTLCPSPRGHVVSLSPWTDAIEGSSPEGSITGTMVFNARAAARPSIPRLTLGCPCYNSLAPQLCSPLSLVSQHHVESLSSPILLACLHLACLLSCGGRCLAGPTRFYIIRRHAHPHDDDDHATSGDHHHGRAQGRDVAGRRVQAADGIDKLA